MWTQCLTSLICGDVADPYDPPLPKMGYVHPPQTCYNQVWSNEFVKWSWSWPNWTHQFGFGWFSFGLGIVAVGLVLGVPVPVLVFIEISRN